MLKITGLKLPLGFREGDLKRAAAKQLRLPESAIGQVRLCKKSVDARKKDNVHFVCAVEAAIQGQDCTFSAFVVAAVQAALDDLHRQEQP